MKHVQVVFPVLRGASRFFIERGRRWSVIEHLVLSAVSVSAASALDLSQKSGLPRRVIVEAFIRLMRAGWVEIVVAGGGLAFKATSAGQKESTSQYLRAATVTEPRWRSFAVDQVTGCVFRGRELDIRPQSKLPTNSEDQIVIRLPALASNAGGDLGEVFSAIEGEDELIVGVDRGAEKLVERYAVVTVRDQAIEGLPTRAGDALTSIIRKAADDALRESDKNRAAQRTQAVARVTHSDLPTNWTTVSGAYDPDDLLTDGPSHEKALQKAIADARQKILIHSTFFSESRAMNILPSLLSAAGRGVAVELFWGQDEIGSEVPSSKLAAEKLRGAIAAAGRQDLITVHPFSTHSHAKLVIADDGKGGWLSIIGSCNWLSTDFKSFEASYRLREPALVGALVCKIADLSRGRPSVWDERTVDLTLLGRRIQSSSNKGTKTVPMKLLFSHDHAQATLEARDRAKKRIFVLSHRMGIAGGPNAILPTVAAAQAKHIEAKIYYGRPTGRFSGEDSAALTRSLSSSGVTLRPVHRPRVHAKVLGWDDNELIVSSFNWLSADPPASDHGRELGLYIEAPRISDTFLRRFEHAMDKAND